MTFISLPLNRKSPSGFGICYIILTFCRCGVVISVCIRILLRILMKLLLSKRSSIELTLNSPPKPHAFVSLQSGMSGSGKPKNSNKKVKKKLTDREV